MSNRAETRKPSGYRDLTHCTHGQATRWAKDLWAVALAVVAMSASAELSWQDDAIYYNVVRVVDGDTVVLESVGTVRLIGIDTPETVDPRKPVEHFGREASEHLRQMLAGQSVRLEFDQTRRDRYGRTLAYLHLRDGSFVNREMVLQGYAFAYVKYPFRYMEDFVTAERSAREAKRGLWQDQRLR